MSMSSTTGNVSNNTGMTLTFTAGPVEHGQDPQILMATLGNGQSGNVFIAHSDGAGVEGTVNAAGSGGTFQLNYDNPVVGSNSGSVTPPTGYKGSADVGSGTNNTITYTLSAA
jgi:hypothetical protein